MKWKPGRVGSLSSVNYTGGYVDGQTKKKSDLIFTRELIVVIDGGARGNNTFSTIRVT